jgi:CDP-glucose 4,6-dehydratase
VATVLLTGASGFLGSAVAAALLERGDAVVAVVRDRDPRTRLYRDGLIDRCIEVRAELADAERLLAEYAPDAVIHLAAQTQVTVASDAPLSTFESNVRGTWRLLEAIRLAPRPPERIVVASSDKAYGRTPPPYTEDAPLSPLAPYDVSKACTDLIAQSYGGHFGLPLAITRCGNIYGPGDCNARRLVPGVCADLAAGRAPRLRSSGRMTREWLYIDDAAAATLAVLDAAPRHRGVAFNLGGGDRASVADVVSTLCRLAGYDGPVPFSAHDPDDEIPHQSLTCDRIAALGWRAETGLAAGLAASWRWHGTTA